DRSTLPVPTVSTETTTSTDIEMLASDLSSQNQEIGSEIPRSVITFEPNPQTKNFTVLPPKTSSPLHTNKALTPPTIHRPSPETDPIVDTLKPPLPPLPRLLLPLHQLLTSLPVNTSKPLPPTIPEKAVTISNHNFLHLTSSRPPVAYPVDSETSPPNPRLRLSLKLSRSDPTLSPPTSSLLPPLP
ncbi:hypothetical protein HID58_023878, partial [Brassica napus]